MGQANVLSLPVQSADVGRGVQRGRAGSAALLMWVIILKAALKSLWANKMRSILAMLGIIIGVGAVIAMLAMGAGAQQQVMARVSAMGTNLLVVRPAQNASGGVKSGTAVNLTLNDARALATDLPHLASVAPVVGGNVQIKYMNQNARVNVTGTSPTYLEIRDFPIQKGRVFTDTEADGNAHVAILGPVTVTNLFGAEDPLDKTVKINGLNFRVVGVLKPKGDQGWFNPDDQVIMPYSTAMHQVFGWFGKQNTVREIDVQADDQPNLTALEASVTDKLRRLHKTEDGAPSDFEIRNQADLIETMTSYAAQFQILLGGIASISLLVGGIGIMNIMLVTVTERTREIGIRKAIGAKNRDILSQFLAEAVVMSGLGGALGAVWGVVGAVLVPKIPMQIFRNSVTLVKPEYVIMSVTVSAVIGVFFGVYPAWKASRLDPIEALRYE